MKLERNLRQRLFSNFTFSQISFGFLESYVIFRDFIENFDGTKWGYNGPEVITRVLRKHCNFESPTATRKCKEFNILPKEECYAIGFDEWQIFFNESSRNEVKLRTKDSHFIHLWNKFSSNYKIKTDSNAAFIDLARKFCPKVYKTREEYF